MCVPDTVADENQRISTISEQGNIMTLLATRQILTHEEPKKVTKQGKPGTPTVLIRKTINKLASGVSRILELYARLSATWDHFSDKLTQELQGLLRSETAFSSFKRMFGEHVMARQFPYMVNEILLKAAIYKLKFYVVLYKLKF